MVTNRQLNLGYSFKDPTLLELALSHRSKGAMNNERLEFLGDSLINTVIAEELFMRFPQATEGQLTRMRAQLVCAEMLVKLAKDLNLGDHIVLGAGEIRSGGHQRKSILADSLEAIIGAIYLDSGNDFVCVRQVLLGYYQDKFSNLQQDQKDPKTVLQESMQARKLPLPIYEVVSISGEHHEQTFNVQCSISLLPDPVFGTGTSRRKAEQAAAAAILEQLNVVKP